MPNTIHIALGDSAGGIIKETFRPEPGNLLVGFDILSDGPLLPITDLKEWQRVRNEYNKTMYSEIDFNYFEENGNDLLLNINKLKDSRKIILWLGSGLADQLFFVWIVQLFKFLSIDLKKLRIIQYYKAPYAAFEVISIGCLNSKQISAHPKPKVIRKIALKDIDLIWHALTASDPSFLIGIFARKSIDPLPLLSRSLKTILGRFPDIKTGLTCWDHELLKCTLTKGPKAARIIGHTIGENIDSIDWVGDLYLYSRLRRLGTETLKMPLVKLTGSSTKMRDTEVTLTEFGKKNLNGEFNFIEINGIDEWIAGIHLQSKTDTVWFRNNNTLKKLKS